MKVLDRIKKIISVIENPDIPFLYYILTCATFISIENFLEIFSDTAIVSFRLLPFSHRLFIPQGASMAIHFLHCSLWWIAVLLIFPLVCTYVTKESIRKTTRIILGFSWIVLITPTVDLIISKGKGINIHYVYPEKFFDLLLIPQGLTPGENLTVGIALAFAFIYSIIKTGKIIKAIIASSLIGLGAMSAFLLPFFIQSFANLFAIKLGIIHPILIVRLLLIIIFIEMLLILYLANRKSLSSFLKGNFLHIIHFILIFILGMLLFRNHIGRLVLENIGSFFLTMFSIALSWSAIALLNPPENNEPPQISHKKTSLGLLLLALICAISVNFPTLFFVILGVGCGFIYYFPPLRLKQILIFSKLLISLPFLLVIILGWLFAGGEILNFPHTFSLYFLVFYGGCLNFIDIKNLGKKETDVKTLPGIFGEKKSKTAIASFFLVAYLITPWLFLENLLFIPALFFAAVQLYLIYRKNYQEKYIILAHLVSLLSLIIWLNSFRGSV